MRNERDSMICLAGELHRLGVGRVQCRVLLRDYSSWMIGGEADLLVEPTSTAALGKALQLLSDRACPMLVIGHGTNLLFDDAGFRGVVIRIADNMSDYAIRDNRIWAQAGVWVPRLARAAARAGLGGLEHTIGIPGTLGGLVVMNGGSQRKAVGDHVTSVQTMDWAGNPRHLTAGECQFSYRSSAFQEGGLIVTEVSLECEAGNPLTMRREMLAILRERSRKFPRKQPNCGSVFVSDGETYRQFGPPGKMIEEAGLKGLRIGDAQVSQRHANFIVNLGGATSADVLELIRRVRQAVYDRTAIWMDCEVRYVTRTGTIRPAHEVL